MRLTLLMMVAFGGWMVTMPALANGWEQLGERLVTFSADRDTIHVGAVDGRFTKIKLKIERNGVRMIDMKVHFGNGEVHDVKLRKFIKAGGQSRTIDLPGGKRVINKVVFTYKSKNNRNKRARVVLYGK